MASEQGGWRRAFCVRHSFDVERFNLWLFFTKKDVFMAVFCTKRNFWWGSGSDFLFFVLWREDAGRSVSTTGNVDGCPFLILPVVGWENPVLNRSGYFEFTGQICCQCEFITGLCSLARADKKKVSSTTSQSIPIQDTCIDSFFLLVLTERESIVVVSCFVMLSLDVRCGMLWLFVICDRSWMVLSLSVSTNNPPL